MNRKEFIATVPFSLMGYTIFGRQLSNSSSDLNSIDPGIVKEFVLAGHNDLEKVKSMLNELPNLINVSHDWGNGDFEEAIEGASHLGNVDIAEFLIANGARLNLFTLTMLGKEDLVIPVLKHYPNTIQAIGPHGFTLLHHAKVGGNKAQGIYDYLVDNGLNVTKVEL